MNRPIICTACNLPFRSWPDWLEHRAGISPEEMPRYESHTRRCLTPREWALMALAEARAMQEAIASSGQEDVQFASLEIVTG